MSRNRIKYLLEQAIKAKEFYHNHTHYVILDEKIVIVEEKTGRMVPDRSWGGGLHQAVEAKERLDLTDPTHTSIKMSFQRYFRLYSKVCGMSGTLQGLDNEFWNIYELTILKVPKRISSSYRIYPEKIYRSKQEKWLAVAQEVESIHKSKRPILVGTRSISDSETLSVELKRLGIEHNILHALHHKREAEIIADAGRLRSVTIATNMAGRGTDIKLSEDSIKLGGLHVIVTERNNSKRVDMQLYGRCARQGQPGSVQAIMSVEDEIFVKRTPRWFQNFSAKYVESSLLQRTIGFIYYTIQYITDRAESKQRREALKNEFRVSNMLSFSDKR